MKNSAGMVRSSTALGNDPFWRVWCKFEPNHINLPAGRRGQWRVTDSISHDGFAWSNTIWHNPYSLCLTLPSTKPYPVGSIIRPHKELNRVLATRKAIHDVAP